MPTKRAMAWARAGEAGRQGKLETKGKSWHGRRQRVLEAAVRAPALARLHSVEQEHLQLQVDLPALLLIVCLVAYPFGMAIYFSLSDYWVGSPGTFIGLDNFREIFKNEVFHQTVYNSFVFTSIAVVIKTVLGVWLALLLFRTFKFKRLIRGAVLLPWVIPTALSTLAWWWMFDSLYSVVNWTAIHLG
jgi:multiple sugar transport system permease protein